MNFPLALRRRIGDNIGMKITGKSAFTLLEMLVVIGIIGVLMGVIISQFGGATESAKAVQCETNMKNLVTAIHACALENTDGHIPAAESFWWQDVNHKNLKWTYPRRIGWISGSEKNSPGNASKVTYQPVSFNDSKDTVFYALTNGASGAMWKAMKADRSSYQCPVHAEAVRKATGTPPGWSYAMNQVFGYQDDKRNGTWWGQSHQSSVVIKRKDYKSERHCSPEKVLMFAELQCADINEPGYDRIDASKFLKASGEMGDPVLKYSDGETIGFNHKVGKRGYSGHVAFADGHVERLAYPRSGSGLSLKDLTEKLCRGHEITYDGKGYADRTTDDN